jgi:hypothetical protein
MSAPCLNAPWFPSPSGSTPGPAGDVATLRWPQETQRLVELRAVNLPRLLVVGHDEPAPIIVDDLEDWVRVPADRDDLETRRARLAARAATRLASTPRVDADGVLHFRDGRSELSPTDQALAEALIARLGEVVPFEALNQAGGPTLRRGTLRVQLARLRTRLAPLGLEVRAVRSRGYLLRVARRDGEAATVSAIEFEPDLPASPATMQLAPVGALR